MDEFLEWADARREADAKGLSVLGSYKPDGTPFYVLVDEGAETGDCLRRAFRGMHGREMSGYEEFVLKLGERVGNA